MPNANAFTALLVEKKPDGAFSRSITQRQIDDLPDGDVVIDVAYSSLNYKDALSASGHPGVTRVFPNTPGIDAAGVVRECRTTDFTPGDEALVTGYDLGMNTPGGLGACIRVPADWVVPLPDGLSQREAMVIGTAGFTATMSLYYLEHNGLTPNKGEVLVTGATGGVGGFAVLLLAHLGYDVVAVTGKADQHDFLRELGAKEVIERNAFAEPSNKPLLKGRFAGMIDTVGGPILAHALKQIRYGGAAAVTGLVASPELPTTVYPFIMRSVTLCGIDSAQLAMPIRRELWSRLAGPWKPAKLESLAHDITLNDAPQYLDALLAGKNKGRVVVNMPQIDG